MDLINAELIYKTFGFIFDSKENMIKELNAYFDENLNMSIDNFYLYLEEYLRENSLTKFIELYIINMEDKYELNALDIKYISDIIKYTNYSIKKEDLDSLSDIVKYYDLYDELINNYGNVYLVEELVKKDSQERINERTIELIDLWRNNHDKDAMEEITNLHKGLISIHIRKYRSDKCSTQDLEQQGKLGLIEAANRFDKTQGYKFSTYAVHWIKKMISKYVMNHTTSFQISNDTYAKIREVNKAKNILTAELERTPTIEEISKETNIDANKIAEYYIDEIPLSPINYDSGEEFESTIEDTQTELPYERAEAQEFPVFINKTIKRLQNSSNTSNRTIWLAIFVLRLGLPFGSLDEYISKTYKEYISRCKSDEEIIKLRQGKTYTFDELGKIFNLSDTRTKQLYTKALEIIKPYVIRFYGVEDCYNNINNNSRKNI